MPRVVIEPLRLAYTVVVDESGQVFGRYYNSVQNHTYSRLHAILL